MGRPQFLGSASSSSLCFHLVLHAEEAQVASKSMQSLTLSGLRHVAGCWHDCGGRAGAAEAGSRMENANWRIIRS